MLLGGKTSARIHFFPTHTILQPSIDVIVAKDVQDTPKIVCSTNQAFQDLQRCSIRTNDSYNDYILDGVLRQEQIEYKRNINVEGTADKGLYNYFDNTLL